MTRPMKTFLNLRLSTSTQELASSAEELARTAEQLDQLVRRFKVTA